MRHARLYESAPAYISEQPQFLNTAIAAKTRLPPDQLLSALKAVEVGRCSTPGIPWWHCAACCGKWPTRTAWHTACGVNGERVRCSGRDGTTMQCPGSAGAQALVAMRPAQAAMGRDFGVQPNGPRPIDLDVIFYEDARMDTSAPPPLPRRFLAQPLPASACQGGMPGRT